MLQIADEVAKNMIDYIEKTGALLDETRLSKEAAAKDAPATVDLLIKRGFLQPTMREAAVVALQDPVKAQASLRKIAEASYTPPPALGRAESEKEAGSDTMKESDRVYYAKLGVL